MAENEEDYGYEISRVNCCVAILHEEGADKEGKRYAVTRNTEDSVERLQFVSLPAHLLVVSLSYARVHHQAKRQKHRVLSEKQNEEKPINVAVGKLVDKQIKNAKGLERE
jgi:hypothetical protein